MEALTFKPEDWGMKRSTANEDFMFLNLGPNHPSAHGAFRIILQLDGEDRRLRPGYWLSPPWRRENGRTSVLAQLHSLTDRIEYLGGCVNEMPYVLAVEKLAGIVVPDRVNVIRVMLSELSRINSHLLYISTFIQDVGAMTRRCSLPLPTVRKFMMWLRRLPVSVCTWPGSVLAVWHTTCRKAGSACCVTSWTGCRSA
ncbi:hypothetical protein WDV93_01205 [Pantoea ananatis]